mgnify:CR=1 FL=1
MGDADEKSPYGHCCDAAVMKPLKVAVVHPVDIYSLTLHIPISFKRHGGRKFLIAPTQPCEAKPKGTILHALALAFLGKPSYEAVPKVEDLCRRIKEAL